MKVIIPNKLDLLSSSIAETDAEDGPLWSSGTTYAKGAKVRHEHVKYESLDDGNSGSDPAKTWSGADAKWKKLEATAPYKMLDDFVETQTRGLEGQPLSFCVSFDRADAFALLNIEGYAAAATIYDLDSLDNSGNPEILWREDMGLVRDIFHLSLYEYNYSPISCVSRIARSDLPMPLRGRLCVTLEGGEEQAPAIGHVIAGRQHELGLTKYSAEIAFTDYSRKTVDDFGVATLVRRSSTDSLSLPLYLHPDQLDYVRETLASVRGLPCLWIGDNADNGHEALTSWGWLEDYRMVCEGPNEIQLALEIQGLI